VDLRPARHFRQWLVGPSRLQAAAGSHLIALAHYLEALAWQREIGEVLTIFGGKNPHPNVAVGGAPCAITVGGSCRAAAMPPRCP
jgi:Ni,Fe-hydrogenase I large subunit